MDALRLASDLISFDTTSTRTNVPITDYVQDKLASWGFFTERLEYDDENGVRKASVIGRLGEGPGGLAYFGHTDVVPATDWHSQEHGAFSPHVADGRLYGRGSSDMKGSVACALAVAAQVASRPLKHPYYVCCTADEEIGYGGALQVIRESQLYRQMVAGGAVGIIGEPTLLQVVYAHKGGCRFTVISHGRSAHSSTGKGLNANLAMIPFLVEMKSLHDDVMQDPAWQNPAFTPPTICWNIGINDHTEAVNITPPQSICTVAFRPMPGQDATILVERARKLAEQHGLEFQVDAVIAPMHVDPNGPFVQELLPLLDQRAPITVSFGSEAGQFTEIANRVVLGPGNIAQAHTKDEWIALEQLQAGAEVYARLVGKYCE